LTVREFYGSGLSLMTSASRDKHRGYIDVLVDGLPGLCWCLCIDCVSHRAADSPIYVCPCRSDRCGCPTNKKTTSEAPVLMIEVTESQRTMVESTVVDQPGCHARLVGLGDVALRDVSTADLEVMMQWVRRRALGRWVRRNHVRKANNRPLFDHDGRSAVEGFVTANRAWFGAAVKKRHITDNPAGDLNKPPRNRQTARALNVGQLQELWDAIFDTGSDDVDLDMLLIWFHLETGARKGGAIGLTVDKLDRDALSSRLIEKYGDKRNQPMSPELIEALLGFARGRGTIDGYLAPDAPVFYYKPQPMISRRLRALGHGLATPTMVDRLEREMAAGWEALDPEVALLADTEPEMGLAYRGIWADHRRFFGYTLLAELPFRADQAIEDHGLNGIEIANFLLVDEYQDLNEADIRLVALLAENGVAIMAIGDDDQSIYGWRMAAPEGIRRFLEDFATTSDYPLTLSRRCGTRIIEAANQLIQTAPDRSAKPVLQAADSAPPGRFEYLRFASSTAEAAGIARIASRRVASGIDPGGVLVLVRSGIDVWRASLATVFVEEGLALADTEWVTKALTEEGVRKAIVVAQLADNPRDSMAWWALIETLTYGVGPSFPKYVQSAREGGERFADTLLRLHAAGFPGGPVSADRAGATVDEILSLLGDLHIEGAELGETGWGGWILDTLGGDSLTVDATRLLEMVGEVVDPKEGLRGFLTQLEPVGQDIAANDAGGIRLMTIARSKGLTVNTVIVAGVEEGLIPMPPPKGNPNEERRLLYVAMTRATDLCVLNFAQRRVGRLARLGAPNSGTRARSPLLADLPIGVWKDGTTLVDSF
jgi:DNA helicase II / ATP-dependent DNA helicase PcrA